MNKQRHVEAIIARLRAVMASDDVEPERKKHLEQALHWAKKLRRYPLKKELVYRSVREIAEGLYRALVKE